MLLFRREMRQGGVMRLIYYFTRAGAKNSKRRIKKPANI